LVTEALLFALSLMLSYLLGSIPTGYLVARVRGIDIQKVGSGNIGATNVLRAIGALPALMVAAFDPLKGALAVLLAMLLGLSEWGMALAGLAAVLGNNFNIFLRLRGGKGIATSIGVFLVIAPVAALAATGVGIFAVAIGRYVSLGSLVGMFSAPLLLAMSHWSPASLSLAIALFCLALLRHRDNLMRLSLGTERRLGER
jgi:glycerol-3-phosphate acyltransferase PlsY